MKKIFILGQVALQQLQGWWAIIKIGATVIGALAFIYTVFVKADNMITDVAKLKSSVDSTNTYLNKFGAEINTLGIELKEDDRQSRQRDAQLATALVAIYGDTPNGKKIIGLLKLKELTQP